MADVRALLKAKRQEARITHPLATYSSSGQLRCVACETSIKHASAWEGHIGSKAHRTQAARLKEARAKEAQREAAEEQERLKRKAMDVDDGGEAADDEDMDEDVSPAPPKKRRVDEELAPAAGATAEPSTKRVALPADFFSDPAMAPPLPPEDDGEDEGEGAAAVPASADGLEAEWEAFQQSVVNAPDYHETYERATVMAEPVLAEEIPHGFPQNGAVAGEDQMDDALEKPDELDEEGRRRKKEQEERELIMDRLVEEEQAQEEADERVSVLKNKLEALKKRRELAKASKKG